MPPQRSDNETTPCPGIDQDFTNQNAALPPKNIAGVLLKGYIARIHMWWPFLSLSSLRKTCAEIYERPQRSRAYDKFMVFMIMALASDEFAHDAWYTNMLDINSPSGYYQTALLFYSSFYDEPRNLQGLQATLLLSIWIFKTGYATQTDDLWHLSRYCMSVAIELGLHRHNPDWLFSPEELESRHRTWWCIYALERHIAITTGRVLSIRDHAVHALMPSFMTTFDGLQGDESRLCPVLQRNGIEPFNHLLRLRQISGRVLESVYIARDKNRQASFTTFLELCNEIERIQGELEEWKRGIDPDLKGTPEFSELKLEYCLLVLLINRPSPTFMIPSHQMVSVCSKAVTSAVHHWRIIDAERGISAICRCHRQFHNLVMVTLAAHYCDWYSSGLLPCPPNYACG